MVNKSNLSSLLIIALGAAMIAVLSQIVVPVGTVPFTLQTLGVGLLASLLRPKEAFGANLLYLGLGAIGLPVFAGGTSGFATLVGPTAGFLWGFLAYAVICSAMVKRNANLLNLILGNLLGTILVYACGIASLHFLANLTWQQAFLVGALPFLLSDALKITLIVLLRQPLLRSLKQTNYFKA